MVIGGARPLQGCNHVATHRERALARIISKSRFRQPRVFSISALVYETNRQIIGTIWHSEYQA